MNKIGILCAVVFAVLLLSVISASTIFACYDPDLMVYPISIASYHFDAFEYKLIHPGQHGYDAKYDRSGSVLAEKWTGRIPVEIYQADPVDFIQSGWGDGEGYYTESQDFLLTIDCWNNKATTFKSVYLYVSDNGTELDTVPLCGRDKCFFDLTVNGTKYVRPYLLGDIEVRTPERGGYSGTVTVPVHWTGECIYLTFGAFIDENHNGKLDCWETKASYSNDTTSFDPINTPTTPVTWGTLKALYH